MACTPNFPLNRSRNSGRYRLPGGRYTFFVCSRKAAVYWLTSVSFCSSTPNARLQHKVSSLTDGAESEFSVWMGTRNRIYMLTKFLGRGLAIPYVAGLALTYLFRKIGRASCRERVLVAV